jgi:hypothetical protein
MRRRADLRDFAFRPCSVFVMLDVLHYLGAGDQLPLLEKAARSLEPDGVLLMREADAAAGFPFQVTKWCERIAEARRGALAEQPAFPQPGGVGRRAREARSRRPRGAGE